MRKLVLIAAILMASASAHAGSYSFKIEGQKVRVNIPRGCASLSCINVSAPGLSDKFKDKDEDTAPAPTAPTASAPAAAPAAAPAPAPAPQVLAAAPASQMPATSSPMISEKVTHLPAPAENVSASTPALSPPPLTAPAATVQPLPPTQVASAPAAPVAAPAPVAVQSATSPVGLWMTEKKEGKVRIEDCNGNLCGYAVDARTGANGEQVLINMKPRGDKWSGRIHDTRSGGTYDSTVALRGSDKLRVQGCMMMFCGGETWTRIE